jgi:hypothetical protein
MQPITFPTHRLLASRGLHYAGASSGNQGHHVRFAIVQPSTQGPPGAFAQWIASQPQSGPGVLPYGSNMGAWRVMNQSQPHGHWQTSAVHIMQQPQPQPPIVQGQMQLMPPQTGLPVCSIVLQKGLTHIRNAPCDQCTLQMVNVARGTMANVIFDPAHPTWMFIVLPNKQCGWSGLHNLQ